MSDIRRAEFQAEKYRNEAHLLNRERDKAVARAVEAEQRVADLEAELHSANERGDHWRQRFAEDTDNILAVSTERDGAVERAKQIELENGNLRGALDYGAQKTEATEVERDAAVALLREMVSIADDLSNAVYHRYGGGIARGVWLEKKEAVRAFLDGITP